MCGIVEAAIVIGAGAALAGAGTSAAGSIQAGKAQKAEAEANRVLSLAAAREAAADAKDELWRSGMAGRYSAGTQEALAGALQLGTGPGTSAGDILSLRFQNSVRNSLTIFENAKRESRQLRNSAEVFRVQGNNLARAGTMRAAGAGLQGIASAASFATAGYQAGVFGGRITNAQTIGPRPT